MTSQGKQFRQQHACDFLSSVTKKKCAEVSGETILSTYIVVKPFRGFAQYPEQITALPRLDAPFQEPHPALGPSGLDAGYFGL